MKLHILSGLHVEFAPFKSDLAAAQAADVIVLAGDMHKGANEIAWARQTFGSKQRIIYVAGNHEFYKHHWDAHLTLLREQAALYSIDFLENHVVLIDGIRFLGALFGRISRTLARPGVLDTRPHAGQLRLPAGRLAPGRTRRVQPARLPARVAAE